MNILDLQSQPIWCLVCNNFALWILIGNEVATFCKKNFLQKCNWVKSYLSLVFWREKSNVLGVGVSIFITTFILKICFSLQITTLMGKRRDPRSRILQEGRRTQQANAPNNGASIVTFYDLAVQFSGIQYHKLGNLPKSFSRG